MRAMQILLALTLALLLPSITYAQIDPVYDGANGIRAQVFATNCLTCHSSTVSGTARQGAPIGIDFDTYIGAFANGFRAVERSVSLGTMPPSGSGLPELTPTQDDAMLAWLRAGFPQGTTTPTNQAPTASASATPASVNEGDTVTLSGAGSTDPEDGSNLTFAWTQLSGTTASLVGANSSQASFTAPDVTASTILTFQLTVTDTDGASDSQTVTVTVADVAAPQNQTPTASASATPASVNEGDTVTLSGVGSTDPEDGSNLTFAWTQLSGTTATLVGANISQASFTAPDVTVSTILTFQLTVTDTDGASDSQIVTVAVADIAMPVNTPPVAIASATPSLVNAGEPVTLSAAGSTDAEDGIPALFFWTQTSGSPVMLTSPNGSETVFTAPAAVDGGETLTFTLTVADSGSLIHSTVASVQVNGIPPNTPPSANAGPVQVVTADAGEPVVLDGSGSMDAEDGSMLRFTWLQRRGPAVELSDSNSSQPTFAVPAPEMEGEPLEPLVFELTVRDNEDATDVATTIVHIGARPELPVGLPELPGTFGLDTITGGPVTLSPQVSTFDGGVLVDNAFLEIVAPNQPLSIEGNINITELDQSKMADLFVLVGFTPRGTDLLLALQQDASGAFSFWNLNPAELQPAMPNILLDERHRLIALNGSFPEAFVGDFLVFLAYQLEESNTLIYGAPIAFRLEEPAIEPVYNGDNGIRARIFAPNCLACHASDVEGLIRFTAPIDVNFDTFENAELSGQRAIDRVMMPDMHVIPDFFDLPPLTQAQLDALVVWGEANFPLSHPMAMAVAMTMTMSGGTEISVNDGEEVILSGAGSVDSKGNSDNSNLTFAWTQTGDTTVEILNDESEEASFVASGIAGETLIFELTVTDSNGLQDSQTVTVTVNN